MDSATPAEGLHFGVVQSTFNTAVTSRLLSGAIDALKRAGVNDDDVTVVKLPGAFEIPLVAQKLATSGRYDAIICLGAVIRGDTPHFDYISAEVARGVGQVALSSGVPVIFGVLTTDTLDQANARSVEGGRNKGFEAGVAAVEMAQLHARLA